VNYLSGTGGTVYTGFRAWKRSSAGTETEITGGAATSIVSRAATGEGIQTSTYSCPATATATTDSLVIRIYQSLTTPPTGLAATFTTEQLGATSIDAATWTLSYYTRRANTNNDRFYWGTATYNSNIADIKWSIARNPLSDNTLNWTASASGDVDHYNIYRSAAGSDAAYSVIGNVPVGTNTYCDTNRGQADATRWWYYVTAVDTATNEGAATTHTQEPGTTPPYSISLTGKAANSWVFVSYPSALSGAIQTILNDAASGDGGTTWTVAKSWDNINKRWLTYRAGSTTNTLINVDNTMGVWLWLTANGGDAALTLSSYAANPASAVNINLYTGWNMVGYPTATARLASATLPSPQTDYMAYWQAATPYLTDTATLTGVTMDDGNGYWVRVTANCVWTVNP
jgi:hypothetical protein